MIKDIFKPFIDRNKKMERYVYNDESIEILIHTKNSFRGMFAHADICIYDNVYSFGCYDMNNSYFFNGFGNGVLMVCNKKDYIDYCKRLDKTVYVFNFNSNKLFINDSRDKVIDIINNSKIYENYYKNSYIDKLSKRINIKCFLPNNNFNKYIFINNNCVDFIKYVLDINANFHTPGRLYTFLINSSINVKKIE